MIQTQPALLLREEQRAWRRQGFAVLAPASAELAAASESVSVAFAGDLTVAGELVEAAYSFAVAPVADLAAVVVEDEVGKAVHTEAVVAGLAGEEEAAVHSVAAGLVAPGFE